MRCFGGRGGRLVGCVLAAGALIALAGASASPASPAAPVPAGVGDDLLPDMRTRPFQELYVQGATCGSRTRSRIAASARSRSSRADRGRRLRRRRDNSNNDRIAFQRVFQDSADPRSPGYFVRSQDTASTSRQVGCMVYHPAHSHWHFEDFAPICPAAGVRRRDRRPLDQGQLLRHRHRPSVPGLPGSPGSSHYGNNGCGREVGRGPVGRLGRHLRRLPRGAEHSRRGAAAGDYCLISRADPVNRLSELNDSNNTFRTRIHLDPAAHQVQALPGACQLGG